MTHQTGLTVAEVTQLRRQVRGAGASFRVTKNRLARRALAGTPFETLAPLFTGPTAIAFSRDPLAAAKVVVEFANRNNKLTIIGGGLVGPGSSMRPGSRSWRRLPSLDELRGKLIGLLQRAGDPAGYVLFRRPRRSLPGCSPPTRNSAVGGGCIPLRADTIISESQE